MDKLCMDELTKEQASINLNLGGANDATTLCKCSWRRSVVKVWQAQQNTTGNKQPKHIEELHTEELAKEQASINLNLIGRAMPKLIADKYVGRTP